MEFRWNDRIGWNGSGHFLTLGTMYDIAGKGLKVTFAAATALLLMAGCGPKEKFPEQPLITFKSFEQLGTSAKLTISFTDGDGDLGLDDSDVQPPFDTASTYYHNLFLNYEELQNGVWEAPDLLLETNYRIPRITPTGQNKTLQGDIAVDLFWPIRPGSPYDTVRFEVMIVDRALNESNRVYSDAIKVEE